MFFVFAKTQALKKSKRRIKVFYINAYRLPLSASLFNHLTQQKRTNACISILRQDRDVENVEPISSTGEINASHRQAIQADKIVVGLRILRRIMLLLGIELHSDKGLFLFGTPGDLRQLGRPGAGVDRQEKAVVVLRDWPKRDFFAGDHDGCLRR